MKLLIYKTWDVITYPFSNFGKGISIFIPHFIGHLIPYPGWDKSKSILMKYALGNCMAWINNHFLQFLLQWRYNERDGVSNHRCLDCLLSRLFGRRSKKSSQLRTTGLCEGNSPMTGEFPAQRASNAKNVFIWWRHHAPCNYWSMSSTSVSDTHVLKCVIAMWPRPLFLIRLLCGSVH